MAKLYFYYAAMNAGKSTVLLQSSYNYQERGMDTLLFVAAYDERYKKNKITSRIGIDADAIPFDDHFDFYHFTKQQQAENSNIKCVLVDDAHFLSKNHVYQLTQIVDQLNLPVLTYGLRSDFRGEPFPGSMYLLVWADNLVEFKTICHCGRKATMNIRVNADGVPTQTGEQIQVGGNERYISLCRKHFMESQLSSKPIEFYKTENHSLVG